MEKVLAGVTRWGGGAVERTGPDGRLLLYVPRGQWMPSGHEAPPVEMLLAETTRRGLREVLLACWPREHYLQTKTALEDLGWREEGTPDDSYHMWLAPDALAAKPELAPGYRRVALREEDAELVNNSWDIGRGEETLPTIRACIALRPSVAVADAESGTPVAWALTRHDGSIGVVTVLPQHRRRGLGSFCVAQLAAQLAETFVFVSADNEASRTLHRGLGFRNTEMRFAWARFSPPGTK